MKQFEMAVDVVPGDIDELNHVNNLVYLRWGAQVAHAHVAELSKHVAHEGIGWVVLRHEIDYKKSALLGDRIRLVTRMGESRRLSFTRHTDIVRESDGALLAQIKSTYCPIRLADNRPINVSAAFREAYTQAWEGPEQVAGTGH